MIGLLGSLQTFDHKTSNISVFKERIAQFFIANKITDEERKKAILLNTFSEDTYVLVRNLCVPELPENVSYDNLLKLLVSNLLPVKSHFAERLKFYNSKRMLNESVSDWEARVKSLAANCAFQTELNTVMRDIFVVGMNDPKIMDRLFEEDVTKAPFQKMVKLALSKESALKEHDVRESLGLVSVKTEPLNFQQQRSKTPSINGSRQQRYGGKNDSSRPTGKNQDGSKVSSVRQVRDSGFKREQQSTSKCFVCGRGNHSSHECTFRNCFCYKCGVKGHLAFQCRRFRGGMFSNFSEFSINYDNDDNGNVKPIYVPKIFC